MPPIKTVLKIFYVAWMVKSFPSSEFLPLAPKQILSKLWKPCTREIISLSRNFSL